MLHHHHYSITELLPCKQSITSTPANDGGPTGPSGMASGLGALLAYVAQAPMIVGNAQPSIIKALSTYAVSSLIELM